MSATWFLRSASVGALACAALSNPGLALAQDSSGLDATPQEVPNTPIVVTGSRIQRDGSEAPVPITVFSSQDLEASGEVELAEALAELPSVSSELNGGTVTGNIQNSGLDAINLRNLGDNRTLVLIDGRRTVSNSGNSNRVSLSTIPTDFVDRVEIITGGASSVYGSDAIAGVVNIITESKRKGLRLGARGGVTEQGDGEEMTFNASWGSKFASDRGYFIVSGTYDKRWDIRAIDREFAIRQVDFDYDSALGINEFDTLFNSNGIPTGGDQPASTFPPNIPRDLSGFTPGGVFWGSSSARDRFFDANGLVPVGPDVQTGNPVPVGTSDNGNTGYFLPNRDGYNQRDLRNLLIPRERYLLAAKLDFEISDATTLFAQAQYSRIDTVETREPNGIGDDSTFPVIDPVTGLSSEIAYGRITCRRATGTGSGSCNPFVPDVVRRDVSTNGTGVSWDRRFVEIGNQLTENERETIRTWAGVRGDAWDGWNWEASVGYGRYDQIQLRRNEINARNLQFGLNAELGPDGQPRCVDATARANGCVPVNIFGVGAISDAAANYIRTDLRQDLTVEQVTAQAYMTGDLFRLPAGPVRTAFGIEFRKDSQKLRGDTLSQLGGTSGNPVPNFGGSISAFEGFGELNIPLLSGQPGAELLSIDLSGRVADYDIGRVGTVFSYRAGLQYAPVSELRLRFQYARAQRAPDLTELFSPPRGDFDTAVDICGGITPASTGQIAANCLAEPGIQAALASLSQAGDPQIFDPGTSIYSPNAGNLTLKEETADTFTIGLVAQPRFLPGLIVTVDYYNIKIDDAITSYNNEDLMRLCYDTTTARAANPFCADISRNPNTGGISELIQREFNLAGFDSAGVDVSVQYRLNMQDTVGLPGALSLRYNATHLLKQDFSFAGLNGIEVSDQRGELISRTFKYRARGSATYELDGFRLRYTANYLGKIRDSNQRLEDYQALLQTNPNAEFPLFLNIGDVWEHDIYASYDFDLGGSKARVYGGVNNLFDRVSPFLPTGTTSGRLTNINTAYDLSGRRFYLGVRLDF